MANVLDQIAAAIQKVEGYYPPGSVVGGVSYPNGSIAYRNNNPGNLNYVGQAGATGADANGYAIFPDYATGYAALINQIQIDANKGMTLQQLIYSWAPPTGDPRGNNNTSAYVQTVSNATGIAPNASVSDAIAGLTSDVAPGTTATAPGNTDTTDTLGSGDGTASNNMFSLTDIENAFSAFPTDVSTAISTSDISNLQPTDWLLLAGVGGIGLLLLSKLFK